MPSLFSGRKEIARRMFSGHRGMFDGILPKIEPS
jgi:hypothetical protein